MAEFRNIQPLTKLIILFTFGILSLKGSEGLALKKTNASKSEFRDDLRCGKKYKAENGLPAKCPLDNPCCSSSFWCGKTDSHCKCPKCENFSPKVAILDSDTLTNPFTPLDQLTELLEELSGPVSEVDGVKMDNISPQHQSIGEVVEEPKKSDTKKRQLSAFLGSALPYLSNFAAGLIKNAFSQLVNRPTKNSYTQSILKNFIPRALSTSHLGNSAVSQSIQTQIRNSNYNSAVATIDSNSKDLETEAHITNKYQRVLTENSSDRRLVNSARHVLKALTSTIDSILSQRLTTLSNLLSSLFTSLIESLRILLVSYHDKHGIDLKKLLIGANNTLAELKRLKPPSNVNIFALLSSILVILVLIFPTLVVLRSSITNHHIKVFHSKYSRNSEGDVRRSQRMNQVDLEDGLFHEEIKGASAEPQVTFKGSRRGRLSRFPRRPSGVLSDV